MTRKLLLADSSATIQRVIELTFAGQDIDVVAVSDGEQAIARFGAEKPDIVLADISVPKRNGYEIAAFVKDHPELSHVPVLLLAGAFEPVDEARAREVGSDGVVVKPFEPQQVIARVRELVGGGPKPEEPAAASATAATEPPTPPASEPAPAWPDLPAAAEEPEMTWPERTPTTAEPAVPDPWFPTPEPRLSKPEVGVSSQEPPDASLDEYFDRLDAAFATLGNAPPASEPATGSALDTPTEPATGSPAFFGALRAPGTAMRGAQPEQDSDAGPHSGPAPPVRDETLELPTVDHLLTDGLPYTPRDAEPPSFGLVEPPPPEPPDSSPTLAHSAAPAVRAPLAAQPGPGNAIAEVFNLLFAVEQGEADPASVRVGPSPAPVRITGDLVDEVTRRVLERVAPDTARALVAEIVSEVAERLVREEIERIKEGLRPRPEA